MRKQMHHPALISVSCLLLALSAGATATAAPATRPSRMPEDFSVLLSRSIFVKGRAPTQHAPPPSTRPSSAARAETVLVFNGATRTSGGYTAFVEDRSTGKVMPLQVNDPLARGRVVGITLDALTYEVNGQTLRIAIGDNLQGQAMGRPSSRPTSAGSTSAPSPQIQSVLERLRQKRQQELQHK
jgi:hypothetical protein